MTCTYPCPYCHNGTVSTLTNYADFHFDSSEPIFEESPCEECGGSGYIEVPQNAGEAQACLPAGMIPVEYWDIDSGARIVTEPSEEGPGGCWVVLNSRHVNPLTEFPTAKAAWDALQQAHTLPLPQGEVK